MSNNIENPLDQYMTEKEKEIFDYTLDLRKKILDDLTDNGKVIPHDNSTIRVMKEIMESLDKRVNDSANIRLKADKDSKSVDAELVAEVLMQVAAKREEENLANFDPTKIQLPEEVEDIEIVKGELDINPKPLTLEEIEGSKNEHSE